MRRLGFRVLLGGLLLISGNLFAVGQARLEVNGESVHIVDLSGSQGVCNWYTSVNPKRFTVILKDKTHAMYLILENFNHNLLMGKADFDVRRDDPSGMSIISFDTLKPRATSYQMDTLQEGSNCVIDFERAGFDVRGKFTCTNLYKWENEQELEGGISSQGTFECPYSVG